MDEQRFLVLRGTAAGPVYLNLFDHSDWTWTRQRDDAHRFRDRVDAAEVQAELVARDGVAAAVVPC